MTIESADQFMARKSLQWEAERARVRRWKDIGRAGTHNWVCEAWTFHPQYNLPEKVLVIQRIRNVGRTGEHAYAGGAKDGDVEYRFGYWIVGRIGRAAGRWVWGQFSPMIPQADLEALLAKAHAEGTIL
jgi:hypothetical protein